MTYLINLYDTNDVNWADHFGTDFDRVIYWGSNVPGGHHPYLTAEGAHEMLKQYCKKYSVRTVKKLIKKVDIRHMKGLPSLDLSIFYEAVEKFDPRSDKEYSEAISTVLQSLKAE